MIGYWKKQKIIAVVEFNNHEAFVLKNKPSLKYNRHGNVIIGTDGIFCETYYYDKPTPSFQAFAGREFDIFLEDGKVIHCKGQWWHGGQSKAEKILNKKMIHHLTARSLDELKKCYVFCGYPGIKKQIDKLRKKYKGKIYGYWEYEKELKDKGVT